MTATDDIAASGARTVLSELEASQAVVKKRWGAGRGLIKRLRSLIRLWTKRHLDRRELLTLLDQDHRIARDMGSNDQELREWAQKPFWLP